MRPGDSVIAAAFGNKRLKRVFVKQIENTVVICKPEEWRSAISENRQPTGVGFPSYDITPTKNGKSH